MADDDKPEIDGLKPGTDEVPLWQTRSQLQPRPPHLDPDPRSWEERWSGIIFGGFAILLALIVGFMIGVTYGQNVYDYSRTEYRDTGRRL